MFVGNDFRTTGVISGIAVLGNTVDAGVDPTEVPGRGEASRVLSCSVSSTLIEDASTLRLD